jgi:glycine betaine transporter
LIKSLFSTFRHQVFWPPFILLVAALVYSVVDVSDFFSKALLVNNFIIDHFGWLFSVGTALMLLTCIVIMFHPIGKTKIGGELAVPMLNTWRWFSIVLCTTIATGLIFWGTAEPIMHLNNPPSFSGANAGSDTAATNAMSYMYLHWTFTPYAIYTIPAIMFALAFYNEKRSFSLKSTLFPFLKQGQSKWLGISIDSICLYSLVAGMSASLGAGILTLSGGLKSIWAIDSKVLLLLITLAIVVTFVVSASTGLLRGIRILSVFNVRIFILLAVFVLIFGPTVSIFHQMLAGFSAYITNLPTFSFISIVYPDDPWPKSWTTFNWANWLAWAPITALFLGRLGVGYTVKKFMVINWLLPSLFGLIWMSIFSGAALDMQLNQGIDLQHLLSVSGPESIIYRLFDSLPLSNIIAAIFLFTAFLSYVTAADSNTEAMGAISSVGISTENQSPTVLIKIVWGATIGAVAFTMVSLAGIEGVKMLSNLGGIPALLLIIVINIGLIKLLFGNFNRRNS